MIIELNWSQTKWVLAPGKRDDLRRERETRGKRSKENRGTKKSREEILKRRTNRCKGPGLSHSCPGTRKKKINHGDGKTGEGGERQQREGVWSQTYLEAEPSLDLRTKRRNLNSMRAVKGSQFSYVIKEKMWRETRKMSNWSSGSIEHWVSIGNSRTLGRPMSKAFQ